MRQWRDLGIPSPPRHSDHVRGNLRGPQAQLRQAWGHIVLPGGAGATSARCLSDGAQREAARKSSVASTRRSSPRGCWPSCNRRRPARRLLIEEQASIQIAAGKSATSLWRTTPCQRAAWVCRVSAFLWACPARTFRSAIELDAPLGSDRALLTCPPDRGRLGHPVDYDLTFWPLSVEKGPTPNNDNRLEINRWPMHCTQRVPFLSSNVTISSSSFRGRSSQARDLGAQHGRRIFTLLRYGESARRTSRVGGMSAAHHFRSA